MEMSLVGLLFLVLLLGILDFGQFLFLQQALVDRTRYAARWGALHDPTNAAAIKNRLLYLRSTAPSDGTKPSFGLTADMISVLTPDAGTDNYRLVIQVSGYSYKVVSPYLSSPVFGAPIRVSVPLGLYN